MYEETHSQKTLNTIFLTLHVSRQTKYKFRNVPVLILSPRSSFNLPNIIANNRSEVYINKYTLCYD